MLTNRASQLALAACLALAQCHTFFQIWSLLAAKKVGDDQNLIDSVCVCFQAPLWAYLLCAVGLFIYQSLDAIDGKQARRTNSSTPLGELFDHGCDSLSTGGEKIA